MYIGWSDVAESIVTIRSLFCGYNTTSCVELNGEDLSCYPNKIESISLRKCLYDHRLINKAYLRAITVTNFVGVFTYKMAIKATGVDMERNYVIVTLCKQFCRTALGNCYGLKLPKCWLQFKKNKFIYYNFRHTCVPYTATRAASPSRQLHDPVAPLIALRPCLEIDLFNQHTLDYDADIKLHYLH